MNAEAFRDYALRLAPMEGEARDRFLRERLAADLGEETPPPWLGTGLALLRDADAAQVFAAQAAEALSHRAGGRALLGSSSTAPSDPLPALLRRLRCRREAEAALRLLALATACAPAPEGGWSRTAEETADAEGGAWGTRGAILPAAALPGLIPSLAEAWRLVREGLRLEVEARFRFPATPTPTANIASPIYVDARALDLGAETVLCFDLGSETPRLCPESLAFFLGAAVARLAYDHVWFLNLAPDRNGGPASAASGEGHLAPEAEAARLRWRALAEFSTDRAGFLACGGFHPAARALLAGELGLDEAVLGEGSEALAAAGESLRESGVLPRFPDRPHSLATRIAALRRFASAWDPSSAPPRADGQEAVRERREADLEDLLDSRRRRPGSPEEDALLEALAAAGVCLLAADGRLDGREARLLVRLLHDGFTDDPESALTRALDRPEERLGEALGRLRRLGDRADAEWLVARLLDLAFADGSAEGFELPFVVRAGEALGLAPEEVAARIAARLGAGR